MDGVEVKILSQAAIDQIKKALGPNGRRAVLAAIARRLKEMTQANFGEEGPYRPEEWPPYARDYPQYEKYEGEPATLIRTGALGRSISVTVADNYAEISTDVDYADIHQFGGAHVPARPFFPIESTRNGALRLTPQAQEEIEKIAYEVFIREMSK